MERSHRVIRLQPNRRSPAFQLHAYMANKKTAPPDGLRLAALTVMEWLCQRLGEHIPPQLGQLPQPDAYLQVGNDCLPSIRLNAGYLVDIVSSPEMGIWSLQITEPDLGSDLGCPHQDRAAVPGRMIETNIGFRIGPHALECGFQIVISHPEGAPPADVPPMEVVRRLAEHPAFGLRQITRLGYEAVELDTVEQLKRVLALWKDPLNHLPCVIFTQPEEPDPSLNLPVFETMSISAAKLQLDQLADTLLTPHPQPIPYDVADFARHQFAFCRTYSLPADLFQRALRAFQWDNAVPGDILVLEPQALDGSITVFPHKVNAERQSQTMADLTQWVRAYLRGKDVSFGEILFPSAARLTFLDAGQEAMQPSKAMQEAWDQQVQELEDRWRAECQRQTDRVWELCEQLARQREYQCQLEGEKEALCQQLRQELEQARQAVSRRDEDLSYFQRKQRQPTEHRDIAPWVEQNFHDHLILHPKAVDLLETKGAKSVSCGLICDALDFLATDYWANRYQRISRDEMLSRCSKKYGRPFEIKHTGNITVEYTPSEYKIKYFPGAKGKPVESPLDYHLRVGSDPENLLRIYFLHDDKHQRIVVGSLPRHLKAVSIK